MGWIHLILLRKEIFNDIILYPFIQSFLQLQNVVDINSGFFNDWNTFSKNNLSEPKRGANVTWDDVDGLGAQHVTLDMLRENNINASDVTIGPENITIEIPLVQKMMPYFVKKQLNLERQIHAIMERSTELLRNHKQRIDNKRIIIRKKHGVNIINNLYIVCFSY